MRHLKDVVLQVEHNLRHEKDSEAFVIVVKLTPRSQLIDEMRTAIASLELPSLVRLATRRIKSLLPAYVSVARRFDPLLCLLGSNRRTWSDWCTSRLAEYLARS